MYQVIIADDEPWVVYGLIHSVDWESMGFTVCGSAEDGVQALEKVCTLKPDVLISDIRMPGLDGLDLLKALRKKLPDIEVVFISGYSEFTYAQQAIRYGAADYLIKDVSARQLAETLKRLKKRLEQKAGRNLGDAYFALLERDDMLSVAQWAKYCCQYREYPHFRFAIFTEEKQITSNWSNEQWKAKSGYFLLRIGRNKYSALLGYTSSDAYAELLSKLKGKGHPVGISSEGCGRDSFTELYREADIAFYTASLNGMHKPLHYHTAAKSQTKQKAGVHLRVLEEALKNNDTDLCARLLKQVGSMCVGMMADSVADVFNSLVLLFKRYRLFDADSIDAYSYRHLVSEFTGIKNVFDFFLQALRATNHSAEFLEKNVLAYVNDHFTEEIRLPDLAARYHFSPSYFSTLFRKHTGTTLTQYVAAKRIALAKLLLTESENSIQDIVERVGYNDYFYFIRVFKREVGVTPGQYRNKSGTLICGKSEVSS